MGVGEEREGCGGGGGGGELFDLVRAEALAEMRALRQPADSIKAVVWSRAARLA